MDIDPQYFFKELSSFLNDDVNGPRQTHRLLDTLNRNLIEEQIDSSVIDIYLLHIFHTHDGLLQFIETAVKNKNFNNASKVAVDILYTIVNNFPSKVPDKDILSIFTLCTKILKSNTDGFVKVKLFQLLLVSLEKSDSWVDSKNAASVVEDLLGALLHAVSQKHSDSVKSKELTILGFFAKKYPYFIQDSRGIQQSFWRNFEIHVAVLPFKKVTQNVIEGFFVGFKYFLESFPLKVGTTEYKKIVENLYKTIKILVVPKERIRLGNRAAMLFLANNTALFEENLLAEYEFWHRKLTDWLTMGSDDRKAGVAVVRAFLQNVATSLCQKEGEEWKKIVVHFNNYSKSILESKESSNSEKRLAIFCLQQFAPASYKHLPPEEVTSLFLAIMQNFEETYILNYDPQSEQWEYLPDYVQAVANFMTFKEFTTSEFFCLQRATINMIKSFHQLPILHFELVVDALIMTLFHLRKTKFFDVFVENVVYQGVVWSCSHQHISNEAFSEETTQKTVTVKNYFPLWTGILNLTSNRVYDKRGFGLEDRKYVLERTVNELVKTLMMLINKLNVSVKLKGDDVVTTDVSQAYTTEATNDYAIFLNLVDFYQEIFEKVKPSMFRKCICKIVTHLVDKCLKYPLTSGFYKLLSFSLKIARNLELFSTHPDQDIGYSTSARGPDVDNCQTTLSTFLALLLNKMPEFKDELLISCLQVLLGTPVVVIKDALPSCVVPLINVFEVGRSYLPLARMGLRTLEYWQENIEPEVLEPILMKIIPSLDSFLRSKSLRGLGQGIVEKRRKTQQAIKKRKVLLEVEPELVTLQREILCFIGRQSLRNLQAFIFSNDNHVRNLISGRDSHLRVTLLYEDLQLNVHLDSFLPRIIDLALHSSDRKTRITACELLQACVMVFLGRAKPMSQSGLSEMNNTLKTLAIPLLQLACDIDQVVEQIFQPLFLQLVHWYTSPTQSRGPHTAIIIDTLMEGITHPTNSSLRDFAGKCVKEFVKWTIKQANENSIARDPINIKILVNNMRFFSSHPDSAKKLGAALIFNNIYRELREEDALVSIFWLEILHIFVLSLSTVMSFEETTTVVQIKHALRHVERVFVEKRFIFREHDEKRRIPNDFRSGLLRDVAVWVLERSGSMAKHCRDMCMELFSNLAPLSSDGKMSVQSFVAKNLDHKLSHVFDGLVSRFGDLKADGCHVLLKWLQGLLSALDGYHFIVRNNLESLSFDNNALFGEMEYFLKHFQSIEITEALNLISHQTWIFTAMDRDQYRILKAACCLSILRLYTSLLRDESLCQQSVSLWGGDFWKLLLNVLFHPQFLGLNDVLHPNYSELLEVLLNTLPRKLAGSKVTELKVAITTLIDREFDATVDLTKNVSLKQRNVLRGIATIAATSFNQIIQVESYATGLIDKLAIAFHKNSSDDGAVLFINEIQDTTLSYVTTLLKFSLRQRNELAALIDRLHEKRIVQCMEFTRETSFGLYFLSIFSEAVLPVIARDFDSFLTLSLAKNNLEVSVELIRCALSLMLKEKAYRSFYKDIVNCLVNHWQPFAEYFEVNENKTRDGLEYVKLLVEMNKASCKKISSWLVKCLLEGNGSNDLETFDLLVSTASDDATEEQTNELKTALTVFNDRIPIVTDSSTKTAAVNKMLTSLPFVRSLPIFEFLISHYLSSEINVEKFHLLSSLARTIDESLQRKILAKVYSMCCDQDIAFSSRYKVATEVLPPLFQNSSLSVFEAFYVENIEAILRKLEERDLELATIHFTLVEVLFLRIPIGTPGRAACPISVSAKKPKLLAVFAGMALNAFKIPARTETARKYKCHAYNALASIVSNSLRKPDFYDKLFVRQLDGQDVLWCGIVNTEVVYDFPVLFDSVPHQRKVLVSIRDELRRKRLGDNAQFKSLRYIESQRLFNSSLSEDVTNFDFTNSVLRLQGKVIEKAEDVVGVQSLIHLDATEINAHECMGTICGLIRHIFDTGVSELPLEGEEDIVLPNWMNGIRTTLLNEKTHNNVKIFLVKVIDNMKDIFSNYSKWFLEPLMQFVVDKCAGNEINYFVTDVLVILSQWASRVTNLSEKEKLLGTKMLDFLIKNLTKERQDVFKYNLDILKMIVESWKDYLTVPTSSLVDLISSEGTAEVGIHVSSVLLVNDLKPWEEGEERDFLNLLLRRMKSPSKSTYRPCAETVGLMLRILNDDQYNEVVDSSLKAISNMEHYVLCLEGIAIHFPQLVDSYHIAKLISPLNQVPDAQKIVHLKIICKRVAISLDILAETNDFKIVSWDQLLEHANLEIQIVTLEIMKKCLNVFIDYDIWHYVVKTLSRNVSNVNVLYRSCVYDIAMQVYNMKRDDTGSCKEMLIYGLNDCDRDNREKVTKFWAENPSLPTTIIQRFPFLLSEIYKSKIEDKFLGYVTYFLIHLLTQYEAYEAKVFEHPLEDCDFEDYRLHTNWRLQHPSVVPMFAETLQTYDPSDNQDEGDPFQLRQTVTTFDFVPTQSFQEQQLMSYTSLETSLSISNSAIKNPNFTILSQKYRIPRRRFLRDKAKISISHAHFETKKQVKKAQKRIDSAVERERNVTIYRSYRKGDFPDIQIALSSVLKPLQMLALHDNEISKLLFLEIFKGIASKAEENQVFLETVSKSIKEIFNSSTQFNPHLFAALLDILLKNKSKISFDPQLVCYVSQESGLVSTGALLLEEYIIMMDELPTSSKRAVGEDTKEALYWVKLAELYKELGEWDTVRAIFLEKMNCHEAVHKAIKFESESNHRNAQDLYKRLIDIDLSPHRKDFYYESYFKCFAEMGQWDELPEFIGSVVEGGNTWDALWDNGWNQQKLLPWYVKANVKKDLNTGSWDGEFLKDINRCLSDSEKSEYLRANFSEELFIMWLSKGDIPAAKLYLKTCVSQFLETWQLTNTMFQSLRFQKLLNLRNVIEGADFIATLKQLMEDPEGLLTNLADRWRKSSEDVFPTVLLNETRLLYRKQFVKLLNDKISGMKGLDLKEHMKKLRIAEVMMDIDFIKFAANSNNYYFARKYFMPYQGKQNLKLNIAYGNIALAKTKLADNVKDEVKWTIPAVDTFTSSMKNSQDQMINLLCSSKLFDIYSKLSCTFVKNPELFIEYKEHLAEKLQNKISSPSDIELCARQLLRRAIDGIDEDMECDNSKNEDKQKEISGAYVKLANFIRDRDDEALQGDFILFVLRAMRMNSSEGRQLFPCVLMQSKLGSEHKAMFLKESEKIPTWMFLGWIPQLLANVDSPKICAISKIIERIAETYPKAIMYPYRLSKENYKFNDENIKSEVQKLTDRLDELLLKDEAVNKFLRALSYVSLPVVILRYYVTKMMKADSLEEFKSIQNSVRDDFFVELCGSKNPENMQGNMFKEIQTFKKEFLKPADTPLAVAKKNWEKTRTKLRDPSRMNKHSSLLKDYCPWLANFSANKLNVELEIPGQYDGKKLPLPQHHVKISGFCPNVKVMDSLRRPIKITMLGMDTKEYPFLLKFGEDIRQDQRIQQLFGMMNDIFKSDTGCANNGLEVLTYEVVPLTSNLGIIQWIDNTQQLKDFLSNSMKNRGTFEKVFAKYVNALPKGKSYFQVYGSNAVRTKKDKAIAFYTSLVYEIPWDLLRTSFWSLSSSTENYIAMRANFIKTYAALCATHWLLGIGDRHLGNSLICLGNGKVLGIDFGHAFGTGTQIQEVPELVPFRLTPHIVSLMEPLGERGLFRQCLVHCLKALRVNGSSLLATMNVFIEEPSLDWLENAKMFEGADSSEEQPRWYPKVKVEQAKRKLYGASSTKIMAEELIAGTRVEEYTAAYVRHVKGDLDRDVRAKFADREDLSPEEQVDCLIDHATDYNLLGRMFVGWAPWV
ncbi:DNA-dependent protein kinase catalytic subunit [Leptinotarsa decemlineata]|uniref:DNA-dependent protein kinase catalytic subunit n=1 Tax=Leptinotarsa decemlineata TaxID=7539 RepID=UPI003D30C7C3